MDSTFVALTVCVGIFTLVAMIWDIRSRRIPNWLNVTGLVVAFGFHAIFNGIEGLLPALGGFAVGFGILFVLWLIGGGGAGDVKLAAALGAWLGAPLMFITFVLSAVLALVVSLAAILYRAATRSPAEASAGGSSATTIVASGRPSRTKVTGSVALPAWVGIAPRHSRYNTVLKTERPA